MKQQRKKTKSLKHYKSTKFIKNNKKPKEHKRNKKRKIIIYFVHTEIQLNTKYKSTPKKWRTFFIKKIKKYMEYCCF